MPKVSLHQPEMDRWEDILIQRYEDDQRDGIHVSDLIICMRRPILLERYIPEWETDTLYRFTFGRAFEKAVFSQLMEGIATQELVLEKEGVIGSIDFGADPRDYECKLTWGVPPDDPTTLLKDKWYWDEQVTTYAAMRGRLGSYLALAEVTPWGLNPLLIYLIEWEQSELDRQWEIILRRADHVRRHREAGSLPKRTIHTSFCKGCPVRTVCYKLPNT